MGTTYKQLSITERRRIERWRHAKVPVDEMARVLKRRRSTIFRELKRNHFSDESMPKHDGYYGAAAQLMTADRRARDRKLIRHPALCKRVIDLLKNGWTPEQIGNRMVFEGAMPRVCQETIYRYIYSKQGQRHDLWWYLPTHRIARRPRRTRRRREPKFHRDVSILFRPDDVAHLQAEIGTQTWFCDPSSPWQKGTVENTNRRARRWLPRKRDIRSMTDQDMKEICDRLNNTPRKCLGWKTPAEVFREKMLEEMR